MSEIEETPATWRDNKTVLRLVRIGFILQFYIPAVVCIILGIIGLLIEAYYFFMPPPIVTGYINIAMVMYELQLVAIIAGLTLVVLAVQWTIFTLILRSEKLRSATPVLWWLIGMNVIHSILWLPMLLVNPLQVTLVRLTPPTILYIMAIREEKKSSL